MFGFLIGVTVGALIGSTIALLLAPESGEELRTQIRMRGENFANEVRQAANERRIELRQQLEQLRAPRASVTPETSNPQDVI
jgi:gas vesicle protein